MEILCKNPMNHIAQNYQLFFLRKNENKYNIYLLGFLFEFLDGTLVDATTLVDHVTSGGRLARVDVANDHDVDMSLILRHVENSNFAMRG